ncbi:MAG: hypothetical protein JRH20_10640 [Deltaproteobacteria bacterium]|nr:hypothetical protein [Deltaproteobacteria bacterium]
MADAKPARFLEPHELQELLLEQKEVKAAVAFAETRAARSEASFLKMDRAAAVLAARAALERLGLTAGRFHSPRLVLRAEVALALALLLEPATPELAGRALLEALTIDPAFTPDPDRFAPRARRLLATVKKKQPRGFKEPEVAELRAVARLTTLETLLWVALGHRAAEVQVQIFVFDASKGQVVLRLEQRVDRKDLEAQVVAVVKRALGHGLVLGSRLSSQPLATSLPQKTPSGVPTPATRRAWYTRWWVWTITAAIIAGGVTVGFVASSPGDPGVRVHLDI